MILKTSLLEKNQKIADLKDEIKAVSKVYTKAMNKAKQFPIMSEQNQASQLAKPFCTSVV